MRLSFSRDGLHFISFRYLSAMGTRERDFAPAASFGFSGVSPPCRYELYNAIVLNAELHFAR